MTALEASADEEAAECVGDPLVVAEALTSVARLSTPARYAVGF